MAGMPAALLLRTQQRACIAAAQPPAALRARNDGNADTFD
jgi:hypothetical protein